METPRFGAIRAECARLQTETIPVVLLLHLSRRKAGTTGYPATAHGLADGIEKRSARVLHDDIALIPPTQNVVQPVRRLGYSAVQVVRTSRVAGKARTALPRYDHSQGALTTKCPFSARTLCRYFTTASARHAERHATRGRGVPSHSGRQADTFALCLVDQKRRIRRQQSALFHRDFRRLFHRRNIGRLGRITVLLHRRAIRRGG